MVLSKFASMLPEDYGYVVMVGCVGNTFLNMWLAINVGRARKRFDIPYPEMYSSNKEFNCIQRAHQNTLENEARFLLLLFVGGLQYPRLSAAAGMVYLISRVAYALGYYTGGDRCLSGSIYCWCKDSFCVGKNQQLRQIAEYPYDMCDYNVSNHCFWNFFCLTECIFQPVWETRTAFTTIGTVSGQTHFSPLLVTVLCVGLEAMLQKCVFMGVMVFVCIRVMYCLVDLEVKCTTTCAVQLI
ncbi:hypothetical protein BaRGS_00014677 [Batillaria attramentaria]|uniref:Glutathione S-transferase 3, mitochondrial n=1 Tax=Batillaria attramentaria TaxID=370345 RepID=A0ABD0L4H0_9CAEN